MKILIGTKSEKKIKATEKVCRELFGIDEEIIASGIEVDSGVPETPYNEKTVEGATNRARAVKEKELADFYVGIETGLAERYNHLYEEAWAVVIDKDNKEYFGYSSGLKVPDFILKIMKEENRDHCDVIGDVEKERNLPKDNRFSYSGGILSREMSFEEALKNALIQAIAPENSLYKL